MAVEVVKKNDADYACQDGSAVVTYQYTRDEEEEEKGMGYINPNDRIPMSMIFCFFAICRLYTIHVGMSRTRKSVKMETDAVPVTKSAKFMHFLFGYESGSQLDATGRQLNVVIKKVVTAAMAFSTSRAMIVRRTAFFCPVRRRRKSRIEVLMRARMGL